MNDSALRLDSIEVSYGSGRRRVPAVRGVSLAVPAGRVVGLVGESGSGKSTLGRVAAGLLRPDSGTVLVGNAASASGELARPGRRAVQMVFQDPSGSLDPKRTIRESIGEALSPRLPRTDRERELLRLIELVRLDPDVLTARPGELSGGMKQRVAIARAVAARPTVLVADEVTAALDVSVQGAVLNLLREVQRELGMGMLFITHNLAIVRYIADEIAVMRNGELVEMGDTEQITRHPNDPYTAQLIAAVPTAA